MMKMPSKSDKKLLSNSKQDSHDVKPTSHEPLGVLLRQAGLVSSARIKAALKQQNRQHKGKRLGEILALQGWLKPETADFFVRELPKLQTQKPQQPIGQYLKLAALLDEKQIEIILTKQKQTNLKFGELAVSNGWLGQETLDFFLENLIDDCSNKKQFNNLDSSLDFEEKKQQFAETCFKLLKFKRKNSFALRLINEIFIWTGGQSFLTEKLCQLVFESFITAGDEAEEIEKIVRTKILNDWETNEAAEHLKAIRSTLLNNQEWEPFRLLTVYQKILQQQKVDEGENLERSQLIDMGLVFEYQGKLIVANRIYQSIFTQSWVAQELANLLKRSLEEASSLVENKTTASNNTLNQQKPVVNNKRKTARNILLIIFLIGVLITLFNIVFKDLKLSKMFQQSNQLLNKKDYQQALAEYDRLLNIDSNYYQAWTNRGYALAGLKEYNEMLQSCTTATIIEPKAVYAWNCRGEALHNLRQYYEAIEAFDRAINLSGFEPIFFMNKSESLLELQEYDESLFFLEEAINIFEQIEAAEGKEKIAREFSVALSNRGRALIKKKQYEDAIASYKRALLYNPNYFPAQIGKGIALTTLRRYSEASQEFRLILAQEQLTDRQKAATWFYLGKTLCNLSQNLAAKTAFETALKLRPNYEAAKQAKKSCDR